MFAPCTMSKHDPQGRGVRWAAKAGITHVMTQPMWNRRSRVYNSEKDKWMITYEGKILVDHDKPAGQRFHGAPSVLWCGGKTTDGNQS